MAQHSLNIDDVVRVLGGDAAYMTVFEGHPQSEIVRLTEGITAEGLTITSQAVRRVLAGLLHREISAEQAQMWASFVRRGYIATVENPVQPILTHYQANRESDIVEAVSRLDELGDLVDGTIDDTELEDLIRRLK